MKQHELNMIQQHFADLCLCLLVMSFVCIGTFTVIPNIYFWIAALFMVLLSFFKAMSIAELEISIDSDAAMVTG